MRMFLDCRSRTNAPQFVMEADPLDPDIVLALMQAEQSVHAVLEFPSRDGSHQAAFRILDVDEFEGAACIKLVRAVPLH